MPRTQAYKKLTGSFCEYKLLPVAQHTKPKHQMDTELWHEALCEERVCALRCMRWSIFLVQVSLSQAAVRSRVSNSEAMMQDLG